MIDLRDLLVLGTFNLTANHIQIQDSILPHRDTGYRDIGDVERFPQPLVRVHEYDVRMTYVTVVVTGTRCSVPCQDTAKTSLRSLTSGLQTTLLHCCKLQAASDIYNLGIGYRYVLQVALYAFTNCIYLTSTYFYRSCINTLQIQHHDEDFLASYFVYHFTLGNDPFVFCRSQRPGSKFGVLSILLHFSE